LGLNLSGRKLRLCCGCAHFSLRQMAELGQDRKNTNNNSPMRHRPGPKTTCEPNVHAPSPSMKTTADSTAWPSPNHIQRCKQIMPLSLRTAKRTRPTGLLTLRGIRAGSANEISRCFDDGLPHESLAVWVKNRINAYTPYAALEEFPYEFCYSKLA